MKSLTITCHDVYNYGASLQAFSLQRFLLNLGIENQIINYKPDYLSKHFKFWGSSNPKYDKKFVKFFYNLALLPERIIKIKKKKKFDKFTNNYLKLTPKRYSSCEEIEKDNLDADFFIAGSDQIWNTLLKNGHDKTFYLSFVKNRKKISYAGSFATEKLYNNSEVKIKNWLKSFDAISVRESSAIKILDGINIKNSTLVLDPVFLTSKDQWEDLIKDRKKNQKNYILLYDCERSELLRKVALKISQITKYPIYCIGSTCRKSYWNKDFRLSGPLDFVEKIRDANIIVTNSFHATAFSVIFEKQFFVINRSMGINNRMNDFLKNIGLSNHLISKPDEIFFEKINYNKIKEKINSLLEISKLFLICNLKK